MFDIEGVTIAKTVAEAIAALERSPESEIICGGTDVLIKVREGKLAGKPLVSVREIPGLSGIELLSDGTIAIGPAATFTEIAEHPVILKHIPVLAHAVGQVGGPQIRNVGTVGGNVCNGVTSADSATSLLCLNAVLVTEGPNGRRETPLAQWYTGPGRTVRGHTEILVQIKIAKADYEGFGGHYIKFAQRAAMDIATLGCAATVRLNAAKNTVEELRLAYGVAAPVPVRCPGAEAAARGKAVSPELIKEIAAAAQADVKPRDSWRASAEFRRHLVAEAGSRAIWQAILNAGGDVL